MRCGCIDILSLFYKNNIVKKMAFVMTIIFCTSFISSCGKTNGDEIFVREPQNNDWENISVHDTSLPKETMEVLPERPITLYVLSMLSDYHGYQMGWFADYLLEKFNVRLYFIGNEKTGYVTGKMLPIDACDIVLWDNSSTDYIDAVSKHKLLDWDANDLLNVYGSYIKENMYPAVKKNRAITTEWVMTGIGNDVAYGEDEIGDFKYYPNLRWDLYKEIGSPQINNLEDYIDVIFEMKNLNHKSDSGKAMCGVSLYTRDDATVPKAVSDLCAACFGLETFGFGFVNVDDGSYETLFEKDGHFVRALQFYNKLYRNGCLDEESNSQSFSRAQSKYTDGQAIFSFDADNFAKRYNSVRHTAQGRAMLPVSAQNQDTLVDGLNQHGGECVWSVGANTKHPELCVALINWMCTPSGRLTMEYGPKGVGWDYDSKGNLCVLESGYLGRIDYNYVLPEYTGYSGKFEFGVPKFNANTWALDTINPESNGQTYNFEYWPNVVSKDISDVEQEWRDINEVENIKEYITKGEYSVKKSSFFTERMKSDGLDTSFYIISKIVCQYSWKAIYSKTEKEFNDYIKLMEDVARDAGLARCERWSKTEAGRIMLISDAS